jgi:hypothetical protein
MIVLLVRRHFWLSFCISEAYAPNELCFERVNDMVEHVKAWQCIGCGKIDAPQTCVGICQDRRVEFVYAFEYDQVLAGLKQERERARLLETLVRQLARTTPSEGGWERSYRAMQSQAPVNSGGICKWQPQCCQYPGRR